MFLRVPMEITATRGGPMMSTPTTDFLTGLFNHRKLRSDFASALRRSKQRAFIMADLDEFKRVNDMYGHVVGDTVIVRVAKTFADKCVASSGCLGPYRIGGESFCAILTEIDAELAVEFAESLRVGGEKIQIGS